MKKRAIVVALLIVLVSLTGYSLYENERQEKIELNRYSEYSKVEDAFTNYTYDDQYLAYMNIALSDVTHDIEKGIVGYTFDVSYNNKKFKDGRLYLFPVDANKQVVKEANLLSFDPSFNEGKDISIHAGRKMTMHNNVSSVKNVDINVVLVIDKKPFYIKIVNGVIEKQ